VTSTADRAGRPRPPAAAGTFYPADAGTLAGTVDRLLAEASPRRDLPDPVGLVVPHAGYTYSGPVAASAYTLLARSAAVPARVAVLGPAHFVPLDGAAVPAAGAWETPLGAVAVDPDLRNAAASRGAAVDDLPHQLEHAVEVQLPFLQRVAGPALAVLPVAVGAAHPDDVATLIGALLSVPGTLLVVSTDLSHYHDHGTARALDARTAEAVVAGDPAAIGSEAACGVHALRGAVAYARRRGHRFEVLDLRTSADTAGDPSRVVGYGAFALG
jgi:AmmeMemoRadiSam system protein B